MRKLLFKVIIICAVVFAFSTAVSANETENPPLEPVAFEFVTSEKDDFQPSNEYSITFSKKITLIAETVIGAKVGVTVLYDESLELPPEVYEPVTIGATQKLIQPVSLKLGDNLIKITVEKEGYETVAIDVVVKRKVETIRDSLQNLIIVPVQIR